MKTIRAGLVGYGLSGSVFHAPLIGSVARLQLTAVMTSRIDQLQRELPRVHPAIRIEELVHDVDLVVIATPTSTHFELARAALLAGKHVVVDKPFTTTVEEAEILMDIATARNLILSVFHNRRWDNDYLTVKKCIMERRLGDLYSYEVHFDRFRPHLKGGWREESQPGSGILYDLGSHLIDQALQLFGKPLLVLSDVVRQRQGAQADDYFHLVLGYGRQRVILHSSMVVREPGPRFAVHGDRGSFVKFGMDPQEDDLRAGKRPGDPNWGLDTQDNYGTLTRADGTRERVETERGAWEKYYEAIAAAILDGAPVPVDPSDAREVIRVIETALRRKQAA
jgi:scyllo-inositol 2-dehydrogenase (NADP+)